MMRTLQLVTALLLVGLSVVAAQSHMSILVAGSGSAPSGGGAAANQTLDPNGTQSVAADWLNSDVNTDNFHTYIDDGATSDDAATFIISYGQDPANYCEFLMPEPSSGTVDAVRVHVRARLGAPMAIDDAAVDISRDGSTWVGMTTIGDLTASYADYQVNFTSLSWATPTDLRFRIRSQRSGSEWMYVTRVRLEINP